MRRKERKIVRMKQGEIDGRKEQSAKRGYPTSKWVQFCEIMLHNGFGVSYYEALKTFSKYVIIRKGKKKFMVRFSNHKPIKYLEEKGTCDFFVGVTNLGVTRTEDAIKATSTYFGVPIVITKQPKAE